MAQGTFSAGVDIGGTKISAVVVNSAGEIVGRAKKKTKAALGFAEVMNRTAECLAQAAEEAGTAVAELNVVGVGAPGPLLPDGTVVNAPNMGWTRVPLSKSLRALFGCPVYSENDCNAGTFGEYKLGAGIGARTLVGLFMGTGLGGGIIIDGKIITGVNYMGAELGHITVQRGGRSCGCGKRGCLEAYASKTGMGFRFRHAILAEKRPSILHELSGKNLDNVSSSVLKQAWLAHDPVAVETLTEAAEYLGEGIANFITLLAPDVVVVGGGVFQELGRQLMPIVKRAAKDACFPAASFRHTKILAAKLGDDAVALGALAYARERQAAEV